MKNHDTVPADHESEQNTPEELYRITRAATEERLRAVSDAHTRHWEILRSLSDNEITTLVAEMGRHEQPMDGSRAVAAVDLIVTQPKLAMVIAERHFTERLSYYDAAVLTINDYLHGLWRGEFLPTDANLEIILKAAMRQQENQQRMSRARAETSSNWPDGCC